MIFFRLMKYNALQILRSKDGIFWTILYPIILASLYAAAFSSMINFSQTKINVGIEENNPQAVYVKIIDIFNIIEIKEEDANYALENKIIDGFIQQDSSLRIMKEGLSQTIIKNVLEQIKQTEKLGIFIPLSDYNKKYIKNINQNNSSYLILFYSLLAMFSLYGMFGAMAIPFSMQANISKLGMRISSTPLNRFLSYLSGIIFYTLFNLTSNILYILFVTYILKINLVTNPSITLIILLIANMFSVIYGISIGSLPFGDENIKTMFCIFSSLLLAFISGMMSPSIKIKIDKTFPILNKINPIGLLTDTLYNVNILQQNNLISMFITFFLTSIFLLLLLIFINSRKVQYDNL